ncbi:ATP-dependent nuclease [Blautia obeum]|uniref:Recombination protein F n=1 Tax=Blautia obeum TaxID=40520 RepID=A0A564UPM4_9FIRM|nr:AAA family ATPase [Blautia obeum]VUX21504.1 recombination protein F [Blautia obeum]
MINYLKIKHYRKLKDIEIDLSKSINIISGTNGTCKSSILYMVSNAFQEVKTTSIWLKNKDVIKNIKGVNNGINLKIESLTRGDEKYNDPAQGERGSLFTCEYEDGVKLEFRRHNTTSDDKNRFALKPYYKRGANEKLPQMPVLYLGLSRLYAYGEYSSDVAQIKKQLPADYFEIIRELYKKFTGITIANEQTQEMGNIKKRTSFSTDFDGIDSNTISSGEDNLLILLTAIVSLRYYYENIDSQHKTESILLVDEIDATLHPAFQNRLLDLMDEYTRKYKIKLICTSHSLSLLEYAFQKKHNVIYLLDNITSVLQMEDADIYKIKMYLHNQSKEDIYISRSIPIFTEDAEARLFLRCIFDSFERKGIGTFSQVRSLFHFVEANISGDALVNIFSDDKLLRSTMRSICIVDGDKKAQHKLENYTIALPGDKSPEELIFEYANELYLQDDAFWLDSTIISLGFTKIYFRDNVLVDINKIEEKIKELKNNKESTKGVKRDSNKKVFNKYRRFFEIVMRKWIADHDEKIEYFYHNLHVLFCKVSEFHDINPKEWIE